ncbi:hypothetical protein [Duganella sp.]|uniref:hypothetical protein n=1 Tax=Duganella sp. TaxID=1904440 RepID=UPI0031DBDF8D
MANDQSIELRVSLQERQMETAVEIVEEIRANYVTRADLKDAIRDLKAYLDERLAHYASKVELERMRQDTRNWMITFGISLAALQFSMLFAFFQLYLHLR